MAKTSSQQAQRKGGKKGAKGANKGRTAGAAGKPGPAENRMESAARAKLHAQKIKLLVKDNPKRPGTEAAARWEFYRNGMTVGEFLEKAKAAGHTHPASDVRYGIKHKLLELHD